MPELDAAMSASTPAPAPALTRRERIGWYAYDFANSAFHQATGAVFAPLLLDALAWIERGNSPEAKRTGKI